ncbi:MAG: hypothetical protein ACFFC7_27610 [Candidatus Hermodarchaeota archaeon]
MFQTTSVTEGTSDNWSIDIWITNKSETTGFEFVNYLQNHLTPEHRTIMLKIKNYFHRKGLLRNGLSSKIYKAVVEEKVQTIDDFEVYLSQNHL